MDVLEWDMVTYNVGKKGKEKTLLDSSFGRATTGELLAILGPSGCGKTTLLNALGGRIRAKGRLAFNGGVLKAGDTVFITQDDVVYDALTPREALKFSAALRDKSKILSSENINERVDTSLNEYNLFNIADTVIGDPSAKNHISGGERKRVCIASGMMSDAPVVLVDEPTSGLDSYSALEVVRILKRVCAQKICVCVIHQPSTELFYEFHRVIILGNQGHVYYFGTPQDLSSTMEEVSLPQPEHVSPQEHGINVVTPQKSEASEQQLNHLERLAYQQMQARQPGVTEDDQYKPSQNRTGNSLYPPTSRQFKFLFWRNILNFKRNPMFFSLRLGSSIWVGLLAGLVFLNLGFTQTGARSRQGALIFVLLSTAFSSQQGVLTYFPTERLIFMREKYEGLYNARTYFMARTATDIPAEIVFPFLTVAIAYWMIGLRPGFQRFLLLALLTMMVVMAAESLGLFISAVTGSLQTALIITPNILVLLMLFSGFFLTLDNVPPYFAWVPPISYIRWAFNAAAISEFRGQEFYCAPGETVGDICPITDGSVVLAQLGIGTFSIFVSIIFLLTIIVTLRILTYLWLEFFVKIDPKGRDMRPDYQNPILQGFEVV
ncbi:hypothetical protein P9112_008365 [Eukaryota sp. TZLM1-RC]